MSRLDKVTEKFGELEFMSHEQAEAMRDLITTQDAKDILEVGFFQGKSSAYIAAILEDLGRGHLVTVDRKTAHKRDPNVHTVLAALELTHRVTPIFAERSFTWELGNMITTEPRPQFDLCYFDADHTWEGTGFGFVLIDMLLRPGGWIVFDDLEWTMDASVKRNGKAPKYWATRSAEERAAPPVKMVFETLVPHFGYTDVHTLCGGWWGVARKPLQRAGVEADTGRNLISRIKGALSGV